MPKAEAPAQATPLGKEEGSAAYGSLAAAVANPSGLLRDTARWLEASDRTDPAKYLAYYFEDFRPRKLKAPLALAWLAMQVGGVLFQFMLYGEVSRHLASYESVLGAYCGPGSMRGEVCLGPMWKLSFTSNLSFAPVADSGGQSEFDFVIASDVSFSFQTESQPPTFLVGVEPQAPHSGARWQTSVAALGGRRPTDHLVLGSPEKPLRAVGSKYTTVSFKEGRPGPHSSWTGSIGLKTSYPDDTNIHVFVVDSRIQHLEDIHKQRQCSFEGSWVNFNQRHSGQHHQILSYTRSATWFFMMVSVATTSMVLHRFYFYVETGKLLTRIVAMKFFLQDFPQQICIAFYLYGWYAQDGLRCQMCLFHPEHCDDEYPLHFRNLMVCVFTLLSACSNQLLMQAKSKEYDEEDAVMLFVRGAIFSVSVLPFSTAFFFLAFTLLNIHSALALIIAGVPALIGWMACLTMPLFALCEDDDF